MTKYLCDKMAIGIWEFLAIAVVVGGLVKIFSRQNSEKSKSRRISRGFEEVEGLLIGGLIMTFVGIGVYSAPYYIPDASPWMFIGGFMTGGIGLALLISFLILRKRY